MRPALAFIIGARRDKLLHLTHSLGRFASVGFFGFFASVINAAMIRVQRRSMQISTRSGIGAPRCIFMPLQQVEVQSRGNQVAIFYKHILVMHDTEPMIASRAVVEAVLRLQELHRSVEGQYQVIMNSKMQK